MNITHINVDIFQIGFLVLILTLGILGKIDWIIVLLFILSSIHIQFKFPVR